MAFSKPMTHNNALMSVAAGGAIAVLDHLQRQRNGVGESAVLHYDGVGAVILAPPGAKCSSVS